MSARDDVEGDAPAESGAGSSARPSRSAQARAATAVNQLGVELTKLPSGDLDRLELPERVREEIEVSQRLKPRSRGRQNRLIGQLLRAEDHEAIRERVELLKSGHRMGVQHEKVNERWVGRLVDQGDPAVEALVAEHPQADRQRLRVLTRNARQDPEASNAKRARRELLRAIRALRA